MEQKRNQVCLLQVFLFLWMGMLVSVAQDMTAETAISTTDPTGIASMSNTNMPDGMAHSAATQDPEAMDDMPTVPCHLYQCNGEQCYRNGSLPGMNANSSCPTYCSMVQHNSSFYESMCDPHCIHHMCNNSVQVGCTIRCCNSSACTTNNDNSTAPSTQVMSTATSTTASTTKTTTLIYSNKKCRSFKCDGTDCYKTQTTAQTKQCQVGINNCELQKIVKTSGVSYEAGCSNTCFTSTKSCSTITTADCFQECCNATTTACCMKLDGQVHFNTASLLRKGSLLKIFTCAFSVMLISRFMSSSHA
ncbi:uncharacterized protein ACNLHF_009682 [Anomaloglossus baeobatrachus]|uniref:uncharacterized protein LOC142291494 n=1 Tax=Anomaloglossus baeobatrachus TaxID=238106 RepID=UPI003F507EC3